MSQVTIHTVEDDCVHIASMPDEQVLELVDGWQQAVTDEQGVITVTLDEDRVSHIATAHIVRIDVDPEAELPWWRQPLSAWWSE